MLVQHYKSIMQYINQGPMFLSVQMHQPERTAHAYMDALQAFWPGLQVSSTVQQFGTPEGDTNAADADTRENKLSGWRHRHKKVKTFFFLSVTASTCFLCSENACSHWENNFYADTRVKKASENRDRHNFLFLVSVSASTLICDCIFICDCILSVSFHF